MKNRLSLQQRLIFPIVLLGLVAVLSNVLAVFSINNVNSNAGTIADDYMASEAQLEEIRRSMMDIHRLALSHIVAQDHATMIKLVQEIKAREADLDEKLAGYKGYVAQEDSQTYSALLEGYEDFKHSLVELVCASASSKTQEAYGMANGDVALYSKATENNIDALYNSVSEKTHVARERLSAVYTSSLITSVVTLTLGILLVAAAFRSIRKSVIAPIRGAMNMLQDSSEGLSGVVGDVRSRTQSSDESVQTLSGLTTELSSTFEEISGSASSIRTSTVSTQDDVASMADECASITSYSIDMRSRAEAVEASAQEQIESIRRRTGEILSVLDEAIKKSQSVKQVNALTKDILSISSSTELIALNASLEAARAGAAGKGFAAVAQEIRKLADACSATANHINEVNGVVTGAVEYLADSAQEMVDYLGKSILSQFEQSARSGQQYREDAVYIEHCIEAFNSRVERLRTVMDEIAGSISGISDSIAGAAADVTGAAGSTRSLVDDMADITTRMETNQEIVRDLQKQVEVFANL